MPIFIAGKVDTIPDLLEHRRCALTMRLARLARRASSLSAPTWVNEDPQFWDDVAKGVDALPASALGRFDEFCERMGGLSGAAL